MNAKLIGLGTLAGFLALSTVFLSLRLVSQSRHISELEARLEQAEDHAQDSFFENANSRIQIQKGASKASSTSTKKIKITCPACKGDGKHVIGHKEQLNPDYYGCSICRGKGHRVMTLTGDEKRCQSCKGMGSIGKKEWDGIRRIDAWTATLCPTCNATGKT